MKKAILILALVATTVFAHAQKVPMSDKGYWTIETTKQSPKLSLVKFYGLDNQLVYQETVAGKKLRVDNNRTRKALNHTLEMALEGKGHDQPIFAMELAK